MGRFEINTRYSTGDVVRLTYWSVGVVHRSLTRWAIATTGCSASDVAQEVMATFYQRSYIGVGKYRLSTIISTETKWTLHRLISIKRRLQREDFIDGLGRFVCSPHDPIAWCEAHDARSFWETYCRRLQAREREMVELRFGIYAPPITVMQLADKFKLNRTRVYQILHKALTKLGTWYRERLVMCRQSDQLSQWVINIDFDAAELDMIDMTAE